MVLGKLPKPGRPTSLDYSRARAYSTCSGAGGGCLDIFSLVYHFSFSLGCERVVRWVWVNFQCRGRAA